MNAFKYFFTLMTGASLGLIAGYIAGTQKEKLLDSHVADEVQSIRESLLKAGKKDLENLNSEYNKMLEETVNEAKKYVDMAKERSKTA